MSETYCAHTPLNTASILLTLQLTYMAGADRLRRCLHQPDTKQILSTRACIAFTYLLSTRACRRMMASITLSPPPLAGVYIFILSYHWPVRRRRMAACAQRMFTAYLRDKTDFRKFINPHNLSNTRRRPVFFAAEQIGEGCRWCRGKKEGETRSSGQAQRAQTPGGFQKVSPESASADFLVLTCLDSTQTVSHLRTT